MKRKYTLRNLLSMLCIIAMIVSMVPVLPAAAADVFHDDMESYTTGAALPVIGDADAADDGDAKYNLSAASTGDYKATVEDDKGTKVLKLTAADAAKVEVQTLEEIGGSYVVEVRMKHESEYYSAITLSGVQLLGASGSTSAYELWIDKDNISYIRFNQKVPDDQKIPGDGTYKALLHVDGTENSDGLSVYQGTWYTFRIIVNEAENTVTAEQYDANGTKMGWRTLTPASIETGYVGLHTNKNTTTYFDDVRITEGLDAANTAPSTGTGTGTGTGTETEEPVVVPTGMITFTDADQIVNTEAVAITAGMGIFAGKEDGKFDPTGVLTRAEMATIIVKMLRGNAFNADNFKGFNKFSDTADYQGGWAEGYINACVQMGVVAGYGDGTFKPGNSVTTAEALTMIINALGVDAGAGEWPLTIMSKAQEMKLYGDLAVKPGTYDALTRDQLAVLVYEGLCYSPANITGYKVPGVDFIFNDVADAMQANGGIVGITEVIGEDALANKIYELKSIEGYIVKNQANSDDEYTTIKTVAGATISFNLKTELNEIGHYVTVYYRDEYKSEKEPGVVYNYVDETQTITVDEAITNSKDYKAAFGKSTKVANYVINVSNTYVEQGIGSTVAGYTAGSAAQTGTYFIYEGEIVGYMPLVSTYAAKVQGVNTFAGNESIELSGVQAPISNTADNDRVTEYDGIKKGDYVTYTVVGTGATATYVLTPVTAVEGVVTKTATNDDGKTVITVDGKEYVEFGNTNNDAGINSPAVNYVNSYTFYITADGKYIGFEKTGGGLDLNKTVFILGELTVVTDDGYGGKIRKTSARGIDMNGNEVNLLMKVEKNGTVAIDGTFSPSGTAKDTIADSAYTTSIPANSFCTYELSTEKDPRKEGLYVLTPYSSTYDKDTSPVYTGSRSVVAGGVYTFGGVMTVGGKATYKNTVAQFIMLEGTYNQTTPLTTTVKSSWGTSTNYGNNMTQYMLLTRNESDAQMMDVVVMVVDDMEATSTLETVYVSNAGLTPVGTTAEGDTYTVYNYKTGVEKNIVIAANGGTFTSAGFWHLVPAEDGGFTIKEKAGDSPSFDYNTTNKTDGDKLYNENLLTNQVFVELANDMLTTSFATGAAGMKQGKGASAGRVLDVRSEDEIYNAGIGEITSLDRIAALAIDHPEIALTFDLCYSNQNDKVTTIFVTDVSFASVGGAQVTNTNGTYALDGYVIDAANLAIIDNTGNLRVGTIDQQLVDLVNKTAAGYDLAVAYKLTAGKVTEITINGMDGEVKIVKTGATYAVDGYTIPADVTIDGEIENMTNKTGTAALDELIAAGDDASFIYEVGADNNVSKITVTIYMAGQAELFELGFNGYTTGESYNATAAGSALTLNDDSMTLVTETLTGGEKVLAATATEQALATELKSDNITAGGSYVVRARVKTNGCETGGEMISLHGVTVANKRYNLWLETNGGVLRGRVRAGAGGSYSSVSGASVKATTPETTWTTVELYVNATANTVRCVLTPDGAAAVEFTVSTNVVVTDGAPISICVWGNNTAARTAYFDYITVESWTPAP